MNRDDKTQLLYNQMFDLVSKRMPAVSRYDKIQAYGYHFLYMCGIAHRLDPVRADNYQKVIGRALRYQQRGQNSGQPGTRSDS